MLVAARRPQEAPLGMGGIPPVDLAQGRVEPVAGASVVVGDSGRDAAGHSRTSPRAGVAHSVTPASSMRLLAFVILLGFAACEPVVSVPFERVGSIADLGYDGITRVSQAVVVADSLSRSDVEQALSAAVRELATETSADAAVVRGFRTEDSVSGGYTVGSAVYAPNGRWGDAGGSGARAVSVTFNEAYFKPRQQLLAEGEAANLGRSSEAEGVVRLTSERDDWGDDNLVAEVPFGTSATVLEAHSEVLPGWVLVRYRVRTTSGARRTQGWVMGADVTRINTEP